MALVVVIVGAALYAAGVRRLRGRRRWPAGRSVAFAAGLAALAVAALPPVATVETERFSVHATQHVLLGMVAPIGVALGAPITLALQAAGRRTQRRLVRIVHSTPIAALTHPVIAWGLFGGSLFGFYFSPLLGLSLRNEAVHELVHLHFFVTGCLFVWPLVGSDPVRWRLPHGARLAAVLFAVPFHAFLGVALLQTSTVLGDGGWTLADQHAGAAILWASGELLAGVAAIVIFFRWAAGEEREAVRADRRARAGQVRPSPADAHQGPVR